MIRALLLDLDNTLLQSDFDQFLAAYLDRLAEHLQAAGPKDEFISLLMAATQGMMADLDPTTTLKGTFDAVFYPSLGIEEPDFRAETDHFYEAIYPELSYLTEPAPGAVEFFEQAAESDVSIVIATNPLFPRRAIEHRLQWAGIDHAHPSIGLITSYETMHFAKPHPEYYAEILGLIGVPAYQAAMIGDDLEGDVLPARLLGMAAFHVEEDGLSGVEPSHPDRVTNWLRDEAESQTDNQAGHQPRAILARMRGHLAALLTLAGRVESNDSWRWRPSATAWAPVEIICHMRDVDQEVNLPRLAKLKVEEGAFLSAANPDSWAEPRRYIDQIPAQALEDFIRARLELIAQLATLSAKQWQRPARHALLGPTYLAEIMGVSADHDLLHLVQLGSTLRELEASGAPH